MDDPDRIINGGVSQTTGDITFNPGDLNQVATDIDTALTAFAGIGPVEVTRSGATFTIKILGPAETDLSDLKADASDLENTTAFVSLTGGSDVDVAANGGNTSIDDLVDDVQTAINAKLIAAGVTLGFFETNLIADGATFTATAVPAGTLPSDMPFSLTVGPAPSGSENTKEDGGPLGGDVLNETQRIVITNAGGGFFRLDFNGNETGNIPYGASTNQVKSALIALNAAWDFDIAASFSETGDTQVTTYTIVFKGSNEDLNVNQMTIDDSGLTPRKYNGILRKADADSKGIVQALQDAINSVIASNTPLEDFDSNVNTPDTRITVSVGLDTGKLTITPDDGSVGISFSSPIQVTAGGGRLSLTAPPVKIPTDPLLPSTEVNRYLQITTDYTDPSYQELGLQSSPTRFNGTTEDEIKFTLNINGADVTVSVPAAVRTALDDGDPVTTTDLVGALQAAIDTELLLTVNPDTLANFAAGDVLVKRTGLNEDSPNGNRVVFEGKAGVVNEFSLYVLDKLPGDLPNGAITELGYDAGQGETKRGKATQFFLEDVSFGGNFGLFLNDVSATASLGILAITATADGTITDPTGDKSFKADVKFDLRNPLVPAIDP